MPEDGDMGYVPMTGFANGQTGKYLLMSDIVVLDVIYTFMPRLYITERFGFQN